MMLLLYFSHIVSSASVMVPVEEQANVGELAPEAFNSQEWELLSPRTGGLEEAANVDLATPMPSDFKAKLRSDQEATPDILELGVSPEASDIDRGNWNSICHLGQKITDFLK